MSTTIREELETLSKTLQEFATTELTRLPKTFEGESMQRVFEPYRLLLSFCASAPNHLEAALDDILRATHPGMKSRLEVLTSKGLIAAPAQYREVLNKRIAHLLPEHVGQTDAQGRKSLKAASVAARQEHMLHILLALSGVAMGGIDHSIVVVKEIAEAFYGAFGVAKGSSKHYEDLGKRLQVLDKIQSILKAMCAMLFLLPNIDDLATKKQPNESMAMERLEAALKTGSLSVQS